MVCSACGFENPAAMRFCGMCGTPLPHPPMTAPGAQSTLNFTRVPLDARTATRGEVQHSGHRGVLVETPPAPTTEPGLAQGESRLTPAHSRVAEMGKPQNGVEGEHEGAPPHPEEPVAKELVPDVPLDEYVQKFRYEPPRETAEFNMRGDARIAPPDVPPKPSIATEERTEAVTDSSSVVTREPATPAVQESASTANDIETRLGLEPDSRIEAAASRPRFLEVNEAKVEAPVGPGTSTIAGPSFLGLNEPAQPYAPAEEVAPSSHWRVWLAVVVLLLLVALALLEWRSQASQSGSGPMEVMRMKLRDWRHGAPPAQSTTQPATPAGNENAKPEIQVQEQPKPAQPTQLAAPVDNTTQDAATAPANPAATNNATTAAPPATTSAPAVSTPTPKASAPPAAATRTPPAETKTAEQPPVTKPAPKRPAPEQEVATRQSVLGADEMLKAKNASDAAATAAWLWKATAKGNPEAPVQLANMYIRGDGVPRSCEQAMVLLKSAATKENAQARNRLASMYSTGTCVQPNRVEAYRWLSAALDANPNSQWAQQNRELLWREMSAGERAQAQRYR